MPYLKKFILAICLALAISNYAEASLSVNTAWDVRPTVGSSTNGGGWIPGGGTNLAIFNNKNAAGCTSCQSASANISTTDGVTAGTDNIVSATGAYTQALVNNIVYIAGGTGSVTAQRYQVISVTNATTFVVDRTTGLTAGTGVTINIGGALDTPLTAQSFNTAGNAIFVKNSGTLTVTASAFTMNNNLTPSSSQPLNRITGYSTVWGDCHAPAQLNCTGGRPTIQATGGSNYYIFTSGVSGWMYENFILDCNSVSNVGGIQSSWYSTVQNNKVTNCATTSIFGNGLEISVMDNEVTGAVATDCIAFASNGVAVALRNYVHDAQCSGITSAGGGTTISFNVIDTLTGSSKNGITVTGRSATITNNIVYSVTAVCASVTSIGAGGNVRNNIFSDCATYGLEAASAWAAYPGYDGNAYFNCTTANRHLVDDTTVNPIDAAGAYTNVLDITLSVSPFTSAAGANFSLNSTAGGGAAIKGTGSPGTLPVLTTVGAMDFGVYQATAAGGGANSAYIQ